MHKILIAAALSVFSVSANAIPVEWTLENIRFDDGTGATGSFVFDADTSEWSDINIRTSIANSFDGATYLELSASATKPSFDDEVWVVNESSGFIDPRAFLLLLEGPMTNAGGIINLQLFGEIACDDVTCDDGYLLRRSELEENTNDGPGYISGSVVPVPAAVWLFGSALAGLGWFRRKTA